MKLYEDNPEPLRTQVDQPLKLKPGEFGYYEFPPVGVLLYCDVIVQADVTLGAAAVFRQVAVAENEMRSLEPVDLVKEIRIVCMDMEIFRAPGYTARLLNLISRQGFCDAPLDELATWRMGFRLPIATRETYGGMNLQARGLRMRLEIWFRNSEELFMSPRCTVDGGTFTVTRYWRSYRGLTY